MELSDLTIVVCCNKNDFFLAKINIASIRYFYPTIPIELIKDKGNGDFNTTELQRVFGIKVLDLGILKMGWSGAKFHYLYLMPKGKKVLLLDADIVFLGPFIEDMLQIFGKADYVVSAEPEADPFADWVKQIYFDVRKVVKAYPDYEYPGFFFNAGQIFATVGAIKTEILDQFFDRHQYPFWKHNDVFPLVDQSVYNYLLPKLASCGNLLLEKASFMVWANSEIVGNLSLDEIGNGRIKIGLIHWAGCSRNPLLGKMKGSHVLKFFEDYYYSKIFLGAPRKLLKNLHAQFFSSLVSFRKLIQRIK